MVGKHYLTYIVFILIAGCFEANLVQGKVLVSDGKSNAEIIIDINAPDIVKYAAAELRDHIAMVTGVEIDIRNSPTNNHEDAVKIFIGDSKYSRALGINTKGLKNGGFRIVSKDDWIAIVGRDYSGPVLCEDRNPWRLVEIYNPELKLAAFGEAGTLYGVYEFLRKTCNIRWYMPGELGMVAPKSNSLDVGDLNIVKAPHFEYRYAWFTLFENQPEDAQWFRRVGFGGVAPVRIMHSFSKFLQFKDTHPEYFALIDGKRDFTNLSTYYPEGNLCLSNPGVKQQWVDMICKIFDDNPDKKVFGVVPSDGMKRICECPQCQAQLNTDSGEAGLFSNYIWGFVDQVAREVAKKHPDKYVGCIAYEKYTAPPTNIEKMSPNVAVMICKTRSKYFDSNLRDEQYKYIKTWSKKTNNLYFWEYYLQCWPPWRHFPTPFPHIISADLKALKEISKGEFIEAESWWGGSSHPLRMGLPGMQHINLYVTARLLWDVNLDVDELLDEYFRLFYGPAADPMKKFWEAAESYWMQQDDVKSKLAVVNENTDSAKVFTPERMKLLSQLLEHAKKITADGSNYRRRVELIDHEFSLGVGGKP